MRSQRSHPGEETSVTAHIQGKDKGKFMQGRGVLGMGHDQVERSA